MAVTASDKPKRALARPRVDLRDPITILREEKLIKAKDISRALSTLGRPFSLRQATDWMANKSGIAFQMNERPKGKRKRGQRGGEWLIRRADMRRKWPQIMDAIEEEKLESADYDHEDDDLG